MSKSTRVENIDHHFKQEGKGVDKYAKSGQKWASSSWKWGGTGNDKNINVDKPTTKIQ